MRPLRIVEVVPDRLQVVLVTEQHTHVAPELLLYRRLQARVPLDHEYLRRVLLRHRPPELSHRILVTLLIIALDHTETEQHCATLAVHATEKHQDLVETGLREALVDEHDVAVGQVVLAHRIRLEEHVVAPPGLIRLFLHV